MELQQQKKDKQITNQNWRPSNGYLQEANRCLVYCLMYSNKTRSLSFPCLLLCLILKQKEPCKKGLLPFNCKNNITPGTRWPWPKALPHSNCINWLKQLLILSSKMNIAPYFTKGPASLLTHLIKFQELAFSRQHISFSLNTRLKRHSLSLTLEEAADCVTLYIKYIFIPTLSYSS